MLREPGETDADAMRRRASAWSQGAEEGRAADHHRWAAMTPADRVEEAWKLIEAAEATSPGVRLAR